jgi:hypothetical protein
MFGLTCEKEGGQDPAAVRSSLIVVRGVADLADEGKSDADVDLACYAAASFAVEVLRNIHV